MPLRPGMRGLSALDVIFHEEEAKRLDGKIFHRVYHMVLRRTLNAPLRWLAGRL